MAVVEESKRGRSQDSSQSGQHQQTSANRQNVGAIFGGTKSNFKKSFLKTSANPKRKIILIKNNEKARGQTQPGKLEIVDCSSEANHRVSRAILELVNNI